MNWLEKLNPVMTTVEMAKLKTKIKDERGAKKVWPAGSEVFEVFKVCPYENTRLVIIGQDPYPNEHAHGIAFSSKQPRNKLPQSLANIFKEIWDELYYDEPYDSCFPESDLTCWVKQGVLLINSVLTVVENEPDSHADIGWEFFTNSVLDLLNEHPNNLVFMFWGAKAKKYQQRITQQRHLILEAAHPSPKSASNGFFGCNHFVQCNNFLQEQFYAQVQKEINECMPYSKMAEIVGKFLLSKGIQTNFEEVKKTAMYYGVRYPKFVEMLAPEIKEKYAINFKTSNNGTEGNTEQA